jgi:hypothetical protein
MVLVFRRGGPVLEGVTGRTITSDAIGAGNMGHTTTNSDGTFTSTDT